MSHTGIASLHFKQRQTYLNWYPLLVTEGRPDVMGLCDGCFVRFQDNFGSVCIYM